VFLHSGRVIAVTFALAAFCIATSAGLMVGNPPTVVILRAMVALLACWALGAVIGVFAQHVVAIEIEAHRLRNPVRDVILPGEEGDEDGAGEDEDLDADILVV
jgi:uncharacterized membrane protein YccC